jgi:hypothetical protein
MQLSTHWYDCSKHRKAFEPALASDQKMTWGLAPGQSLCAINK